MANEEVEQEPVDSLESEIPQASLPSYRDLFRRTCREAATAIPKAKTQLELQKELHLVGVAKLLFELDQSTPWEDRVAAVEAGLAEVLENQRELLRLLGDVREVAPQVVQHTPTESLANLQAPRLPGL